ncbi:MAG: UDP-N-acetylmuramoyl-L-alanine--D-glutamate ligase [Marinicellaceae bacterium]
MKLSDLSEKKIGIWGFGVEGQATADYLKRKGLDFSVLCSPKEVDKQYTCITDKVDTKLLNCFDVIVKSPGISPYPEYVQKCQAHITSPTALWFANEKKTTVIAITGTKGKSTLVSLLTHILNAFDKKTHLVGNIGQALISSHSDYDYIVLEASSFQIYDGNIAAEIALLNNLYPEHLDWHNGQDNYFHDKLKIFDNAEIKITNAQDSRIQQRLPAKGLIYFNHKDGFHVLNSVLFYQKQKILDLTEIQLIGHHNLENIGAVLTICLQLNLDLIKCVEAIKYFKPLVHRLQNLGKVGQHYAINDSIATTPIATLAAMQTVDLSQTTLLIGGFDRGHDWTDFAEALNNNPPNLLLISGQNAQAIFQHLRQLKAEFNYKLLEDLSSAIKYAKLNSPKNHTLLLSPGAPSFDQFESYIQRGEFFQKEFKKDVS